MKILPTYPNLQFLLREAKGLKSSHRKGDINVCAIIGHFDTSLHGLNSQEILDSRFSILDAQRVVARQYGYSSWPRLKKYVDRCQLGKNPSDERLRRTLLERQEEINEAQKELATLKKMGSADPKNRKLKAEVKSKYRSYRQLAQDSTGFLGLAYDAHGWPGPDIVGPDCVDALTLVAGNAVCDAEFQYRSTQLMSEALSRGGFNAYWYAQMHDRNLVLSKKPTTYGSSFGYYFDSEGSFKLFESDVEDPDNLDKRRARVGHKSMAATRQWFAKEAAANNWEANTREQCLKELEQLSTEGGYGLA